jgi:hypothetical protein
MLLGRAAEPLVGEGAKLTIEVVFNDPDHRQTDFR